MHTMLPRHESPVHQLVSKWRTSRRPTPGEINACRASLYTAAVHEISANARAGTIYDPLSDKRFK